MAAYKAPPPKVRRKSFRTDGYEFAGGGMPMAPPDPGQALKQQMAQVPSKDQGKIKKALKMSLQNALKAKKQAPAMPMPPAPPPGAGGAPMPPAVPTAMRCGGAVKKAIGGAVRGVGIAKKGGGRGKIC